MRDPDSSSEEWRLVAVCVDHRIVESFQLQGTFKSYFVLLPCEK